MKLGEALVKATRNCGELVPRYSQHLLSALLTGVKDPEPLVRASSVSNLGDVCQLLRFSLGSVVNEVCNLPLKRCGLNKYIAAYISFFFLVVVPSCLRKKSRNQVLRVACMCSV